MRKEYDFSSSRKNPYASQLDKDSTRYLKIVEWSDEDQCFVGQCPSVIGPCCHGDDEITVYTELCTIVDEWLALWKQEGKPLPPPTYGKGIAQNWRMLPSKLFALKTVDNDDRLVLTVFRFPNKYH